MNLSGVTESRLLPGIIFDCRESGLCNRLRALIGYKVLSVLRGVPFYLHWRANARCNSTIEDLFECDFFEPISAERIEPLVASGTAQVYTSLDWFSTIWKKYARNEFRWRDFALEVSRALKQLRPRARIADRVEEYARTQKIETMVGIHIRHTDNLRFYQRWAGLRKGVFDPRAVSKMDAFVRTVEDNSRKNQVCFLATDNPELEASLLEVYGSALRVFPKRYVAPDEQSSIRTTPIEDALIELLLLARCKTLVGTYYSSFSKLSAIWGGAQYFEAKGNRIVRNAAVERIQIELGTFRGDGRWWRQMITPLRPRL
jgi:hypothetical protein